MTGKKRTGVCEGGGFSERSPSLALPPEERLAFGLCASAGMVPPESGVRFSIRLVEVTAADRAAATVRGASADAGEGVSSVSLRLIVPSAEGAFWWSCMEATCFNTKGTGIGWRVICQPMPVLSFYFYVPHAAKVAAALSAAVTTTNLQENAPTSQGRTSM